MKQLFKELFEYGHHSNQKLSIAFHEHPNKQSEKTIKLFSHILNAHQIWNNRIEPTQPTFEVWQIHNIQDFKRIDQANFEKSLKLLDRFDLNASANYANSKGQNFNNSIRDIFFHIVNHSTYHRAQIATEFKQNGINPLVTDFIFYKR